MGRRRTRWILSILILLVAVAVGVGWDMLDRGFSARMEPNRIEKFIAPRIRNMAIPRDAKEAKNPVAESPDVLDQAMEHFADHCAFCHGSDGSGQTQIGRGEYPKAPDMR